MKDFLLKPKGLVDITVISESGKTTTFKTNTVLPNAKKLISHCIAGDSSFKVDILQVFKGSALLASKTVQVSYPSDYKVRFTATFAGGEIDSDLFNKAMLINSVYGEFSIAQGFEVTINPTDKVSVGWEITIL